MNLFKFVTRASLLAMLPLLIIPAAPPAPGIIPPPPPQAPAPGAPQPPAPGAASSAKPITYVNKSKLINTTFPTVKITNKSTKKATLTSITVDYGLGNTAATATKNSISANTNLEIKPAPHAGIKFSPTLGIPTLTSGIFPGMVSAISIDKQALTISPSSSTITINHNAKGWFIVKKKQATKKTGNTKTTAKKKNAKSSKAITKKAKTATPGVLAPTTMPQPATTGIVATPATT